MSKVGKAALQIKNGDAVATERGYVTVNDQTVCIFNTPVDLAHPLLLRAYVMAPGEQVRYDPNTGVHHVEF